MAQRKSTTLVLVFLGQSYSGTLHSGKYSTYSFIRCLGPLPSHNTRVQMPTLPCSGYSYRFTALYLFIRLAGFLTISPTTFLKRKHWHANEKQFILHSMYFKVYNVVPSLSIVCTSILAPYMATKLLARGRTITFTRRFMEVRNSSIVQMGISFILQSVSLLGMSLCLLMVSLSSTFESSLTLFTLAMAVRGLHHAGY